MYEHLKYMKDDLDQPTGRHFNLPNHSHNDAHFEIIEVLKNNPDDPKTLILRNRLEQFWITKLQTARPKGINLQLTR